MKLRDDHICLPNECMCVCALAEVGEPGRDPSIIHAAACVYMYGLVTADCNQLCLETDVFHIH